MSKTTRNYKDSMQYRRFGRTDMDLSVITLGGMRFVHGWEKPREDVPRDTIEHCMRVTQRALDEGINHIETAYGYAKSEYCYGQVLNKELGIPRDRYYLMTKGSPKTAAEVRPMIEEQLKGLQTDHIDLYGWHGINNEELFDAACGSGGAVKELYKLKEEGVIGKIGFSTHGQTDIICKAIDTDMFDFVNLHYYYFWQRNWPAVYLAGMKDMGVFIISPNDKGGQLFNPSDKLKSLCAPLTPIQFNAKYCLRSPLIHTLTFGMTEDSHFDEMQGILPAAIPLSPDEQQILHRMDGALQEDPYSAYDGYEMYGDPSGINISDVLRFRRMWKCYDMIDFCKYRYNMFKPDSSWFQGEFATPDKVAQINMSKVPTGIPLQDMLTEAHDAFFIPPDKKDD